MQHNITHSPFIQIYSYNKHSNPRNFQLVFRNKMWAITFFQQNNQGLDLCDCLVCKFQRNSLRSSTCEKLDSCKIHKDIVYIANTEVRKVHFKWEGKGTQHKLLIRTRLDWMYSPSCLNKFKSRKSLCLHFRTIIIILSYITSVMKLAKKGRRLKKTDGGLFLFTWHFVARR